MIQIDSPGVPVGNVTAKSDATKILLVVYMPYATLALLVRHNKPIKMATKSWCKPYRGWPANNTTRKAADFCGNGFGAPGIPGFPFPFPLLP